MAALSPEVRTWRTAFLTLRDETLTSPTRTPISQLLHQLIFSQSLNLLSAAPDLPPHELTSDLLFLFRLVTINHHGTLPMIPTFTNLSRLVIFIHFPFSLIISNQFLQFMLTLLYCRCMIFAFVFLLSLARHRGLSFLILLAIYWNVSFIEFLLRLTLFQMPLNA